LKHPALLALSPSLAVRRLALAQLDAAATACARVLQRDDAQALHDFRVALRRLRSVLRAYASWCDPVPKNLRKRLRRLARATNAARDVEAQIEWLRHTQPRLKPNAQSGLAWLLEHLVRRQRSATSAVRMLVRKEFAVLEPRLRAALRICKHGRDSATKAGVAFAQATNERLLAYCTELATDLTGISSVTDREQIHAARISGKRLRYLLEPLRGSVRGAAGLVKNMKTFQDRFGELNDRFVAAHEIAQVLESGDARAEQVAPGLRALAAWVERDTNRRYRDIRARYLGRRARQLLAPMRELSRKLAVANAASDSKPQRVRLK
jgi:CHAD domain-containing protein